jgi:hypothetical protein
MSKFNMIGHIPIPVITAIDGEIEYAKLLGSDRVQDQERPHTTAEYLTMLRTYLREAEEKWTRNGGDIMALHSVRKIAAIAIRCMRRRA